MIVIFNFLKNVKVILFTKSPLNNSIFVLTFRGMKTLYKTLTTIVL